MEQNKTKQKLPRSGGGTRFSKRMISPKTIHSRDPKQSTWKKVLSGLPHTIASLSAANSSAAVYGPTSRVNSPSSLGEMRILMY